MDEVLDFRPLVDTLPKDVTRTRGLDVDYRPMLTLPEHYARDDEITGHIYGLQIL